MHFEIQAGQNISWTGKSSKELLRSELRRRTTKGVIKGIKSKQDKFLNCFSQVPNVRLVDAQAAPWGYPASLPWGCNPFCGAEAWKCEEDKCSSLPLNSSGNYERDATNEPGSCSLLQEEESRGWTWSSKSGLEFAFNELLTPPPPPPFGKRVFYWGGMRLGKTMHPQCPEWKHYFFYFIEYWAKYQCVDTCITDILAQKLILSNKNLFLHSGRAADQVCPECAPGQLWNPRLS